MDINKSIALLEKLRPCFFWLNYFYPLSSSVPIAYKLHCFFPQKILRYNGNIPWPVHKSSRIINWKKIQVKKGWCAPGLSANCYIQARNGIVFGNNVRIGPGVGIISASHDLDDYDHHQGNVPIQIGDNVWIGMNSVILPGVRVGDNVAIGAGSIVTADIPSNSIAVGNPCQVIKKKGPYKAKNNTFSAKKKTFSC